MKKFTGDTNAITPTYEYIILIGILIIYVTLFLTVYADEFGIAPLRTAMQTQFEDVGNDISSKVVDMYVTAPESGYLKTKFYIPEAVGKYEYKVEFLNQSVMGDDQLVVSALRFEKEVIITLNKIGSSLGLNGSTYSASPEHWLIYSMSSQYDVTAVGVVYPRETSYNLTTSSSETIIFDGSDSKGLGQLQYTWDFGDGTNSTNATEYHQYSSEGIYNATLTVYDPLQDRSATSTVQVNVTRAYIEPSLDAYKYVSPRSFRVGKPSYTSIVLYGKGIPQNESHLDVMQVTDVSGSMDPDWLKGAGYDLDTGYTPISNVSINGSAASKIWTQTFSLTTASGETIEKLHVELWNISGNNNVDLWVKPPSGIAERAQNITSWYERYEIANPALGAYTIYVLGDFSTGSQQFKVNVNKTSMIAISGAADTYAWNNTSYNLNIAKWMETNITWPDKDVDLNLHMVDPSSVDNLPTAANLSSPSRNWERVYLTSIKAGSWTVGVYNNGSYPPPDFSISASPYVRTIWQSESTSYTVTLTSLNDFAGSITVSVSGLPVGASYSFTNPVTLSAGQTISRTLSVYTSFTTPVGNYSLTITGTNGTITHSTTVYLNVTPYDITVNAWCLVNSTWVSVPITLDGSPTGLNTQASFTGLTGTHTLQVPATDSLGHPFSYWRRPDGSTTSSNPITFSRGGTYTAYYGSTPYSVTIQAWCYDEGKDPNVDITMDGSPTGFKTPRTFTGLTGTHTFTVPNSDPNGHPFWRWRETGSTSTTITMSSGGTRTADYGTPDFTLSNPGMQTVNQGSSKTATITVTSIAGYSQVVTLTTSGEPSGTTISFTPSNSGTPTFSRTMNINVGAGTATGDYSITITGTGADGKVHTQTFTLRVIPPPDFSISASPSQQNVKSSGDSTTFTVTLTSLNNFAGSISLSASGFPVGASGTFSTNPVSLSAGQVKTSTLTITVLPGTPIGDYTLTITGQSGSTTHSTTVILKVTPPPPGWIYWLARLYESASSGLWISAKAAPAIESFTGYIRLGETPVTSFSDTLIASEPPRWDNTESPILINDSIKNFKIGMNYSDEFGNRTLHFWVSKNGSAPQLVAGLMGEYYDNKDLTKLMLTRLDPVVNFNWGGGSPDPSMGADTFSVRWTGYVKVDRSETYTFYVYTDDGSRVWINDTLVIDSWFDQSATERSGTIALTAGWHKIRYEYYDNTGSATARLSYSSPSTPKQVIPQDHLSPVYMKGNISLNYTEINVTAPANYTVYVTGTFLDGTQNFNLQTYMAKLDAARISGKTFEDMLNTTSDKSGLVSFGGNVTIMNVSDVRLIQNLTYNHSLVKTGFDALSAHNGTPTGEAIYVATQELNSSSEYFTKNNRTRVPVIILLSDGLPTLPATEAEIASANYTRAVQYAYDQANIAKTRGIMIYTIGFGVDADMSVLANISSGEGYYFFAATKEELQAIYMQIVRELREYAARNVVITDVVPAGINVASAPGAYSVTKNADGTTTIVWKIGGVKIFKYGHTPVVRRLTISTMSVGSTQANVFNLSNVTYTNVVTGNTTTLIFPQTNIYVRSAGGGQMSME